MKKKTCECVWLGQTDHLRMSLNSLLPLAIHHASSDRPCVFLHGLLVSSVRRRRIIQDPHWQSSRSPHTFLRENLPPLLSLVRAPRNLDSHIHHSTNCCCRNFVAGGGTGTGLRCRFLDFRHSRTAIARGLQTRFRGECGLTGTGDQTPYLPHWITFCSVILTEAERRTLLPQPDRRAVYNYVNLPPEEKFPDSFYKRKPQITVSFFSIFLFFQFSVLFDSSEYLQ